MPIPTLRWCFSSFDSGPGCSRRTTANAHSMVADATLSPSAVICASDSTSHVTVATQPCASASASAHELRSARRWNNPARSPARISTNVSVTHTKA
jgi:hypothetical protein